MCVVLAGLRHRRIKLAGVLYDDYATVEPCRGAFTTSGTESLDADRLRRLPIPESRRCAREISLSTKLYRTPRAGFNTVTSIRQPRSPEFFGAHVFAKFREW